MNGVFVIDKPAGLTSHDVVNRVRRILQQRDVGHLGTLDPMATGVLPLVTGSLTRLAQFYTGAEKSYEGTIRFGFATDTYDREGDPTGSAQEVALSLEELQALARRFQGHIQQAPPPFSAKKVNGVPAYKLARKKQDIQLAPVEVEVKELEITGVAGCEARFRATVSAGTYVRSIAHEMGQALNCGAHLESLRRTAAGEFKIGDAHTLEALANAATDGRTSDLLIHPRQLLPSMPSVTADDEQASRIRHGQSVNLAELSRAPLVKVFYGQRDLIAIATRIAGSLFHAKIVFNVR